MVNLISFSFKYESKIEVNSARLFCVNFPRRQGRTRLAKHK